MDYNSDKSFVLPGSESKMGFVGDGERLDLGHKRLKMKDLDSVFNSESKGIVPHYTKFWMKGHAADSYYAAQKEMFRANREIVTINYDVAESVERKKRTDCTSLDLNASVDLTSVSAPQFAYNQNDMTSDSNMKIDQPKGFCFDLNVEDVSSSDNHDHDPVCPYKHVEQLKLRDDLECGSTCSAVEDKDPMKVWKTMKQNGFMSTSHGGIPIPKRRGRKPKADVLKKKMEIAKREQVDRFAKIAAPSGLLNGLNPGIINHVRNSKQVHSIMEALLRSERRDSFHNGNNEEKIPTKTERIESSDDSRNPNFLEIKGYNLCHENGSLNNASTLGQTSQCAAVRDNYASSMNTSTLCDEDSTDLSSVSSLSFKAANVASQWLELLQHDIIGRLGALRRSKKRVRSVIQTDLPLLISREFSHNQQNDPYITKIPVPSSSVNATANLHKARWSTLFNQMEDALSDEERQLENWLKQVKEMQKQFGCDLSQCTGKPGMQQLGTSETEYRIENSNDHERVLAVRAAAAAFYSTCNFSQSVGNLPCF